MNDNNNTGARIADRSQHMSSDSTCNKGTETPKKLTVLKVVQFSERFKRVKSLNICPAQG